MANTVPQGSGWATTIAPWLAIFGSVITIALSNYFSGQQQIKQESRKLKTAAYETFYSAFIAMLTDGPSDMNRKEFSRSYNRVLFVGSDAVISTLVPWYDKVQQNPNMGIGELAGLLDTMRKDLGISQQTTLRRVGFIPVGWKASAPPGPKPAE